MNSFFRQILDFASAYPSVVYGLTGLMALVEALPVVGAFIPGALFLIAVGALVPMEGLEGNDAEQAKEKERLEKELGKLQGERDYLTKKLANPAFGARARRRRVRWVRASGRPCSMSCTSRASWTSRPPR